MPDPNWRYQDPSMLPVDERQAMAQMRDPVPPEQPQEQPQGPMAQLLELLSGMQLDPAANLRETTSLAADVGGEMLGAGAEWAGEQMERPEVQSWLAPTEGISRAIGAAIAGQNPFVDGGIEGPLVSEALTERGVNPILAGMFEFLVPDPTGAKRVSDLIPLLGIIGPAGLRMLAGDAPGALKKTGSAGIVEFMPAGILHDAAGNMPRRSPAEQTAFRRMLEAEGGISDPVIIMYDPDTMRWKVGEGNHRVLAALEGDHPVPVTMVRGMVRENEGLTLPDAGVQGIRAIEEARHGYTPGSGRPSEIGLPTHDFDTMLDFARANPEFRAGGDEMLDDMMFALSEIFQAHADRPFPSTGQAIGRASAQAQPDFSHTLQRAAEDGGFEHWSQWLDAARDIGLGEENVMRIVMDATDLTEDQIQAAIAARRVLDSDWHGTMTTGQFHSAADEGTVLHQLQRIADADFHAQADAGARALAGEAARPTGTLMRDAGETLAAFRAGLRGEDTMRDAMRLVDEIDEAIAALRSQHGSLDAMPDGARRQYRQLASTRHNLFREIEVP